MDLSFEMKTVALLFAVQKSCGQNLVFDAANLSILSGFHGHMIFLFRLRVHIFWIKRQKLTNEWLQSTTTKNTILSSRDELTHFNKGW